MVYPSASTFDPDNLVFRIISKVGRKQTRSDSSNSDSVKLMSLLTTLIFDFHHVISALMILLTTTTRLCHQSKAALKCRLVIIGASPIVTNKKNGTACGLQFSVPAECFSLKFVAVQCYQIPVIFLNYFELNAYIQHMTVILSRF